MSTEPNKPVVLRAVNHAAVAPPKDPHKEGIAFERVAEAACPFCNAKVPLADAEPVSNTACPACGKPVFVPARLGGFLLCGHIGDGEMGSIYRALDESLGREVAIKLVRGCSASDPESRERLRREACAAGKLNHPRVAQVYALNFSNGQPYLVMELVKGQDFAKKMGEAGHLDERAVLRMALDVAEGLTALNREGLVHGDIKPGNIVLDRDGNAKLVDFGLSGMSRLDANGAFVGTPNFVAPELLQGAVDTHRSDLYSFGGTLYYLLSGHPPFEGATTIDILKARLTRSPVPLEKVAPRVSADTRKLVMSLLERHPIRRPATSEAVAVELRRILSRLDLQASLPATLPPPSPFHLPAGGIPWRRVGVLAASGAAFLLVVWVAARAVSARLLPGPAAEDGTNNAPAAAALRTSLDKAAGRASEPPQPFVAGPLDYPVVVSPLWSSVNLGANTPRGSTMLAGDTLIVRGTGQDMLKGADCCRFVCARVGGDYALSTRVEGFAAQASGVAGLLVKGDDLAQPSGLCFGVRGSGELFLQARLPSGKAVFVRRAQVPTPLPVHLLLARRGRTFEACVSGDGREWASFGVCALDLAPTNIVGCCVAAQDLSALATAKFSGLRLALREARP